MYVVMADCEIGGVTEAMARSSAKRKRKLFYATVQVTRVEDWCVEAESAEEARALLASGEGERYRLGDCVYLEVHDVTE
jgi:xanthine/CO dehydrogenase XdhC/CoxF family maturation factor